ncbi:hypothetical protein PTTG_26780 [Puccinia triticina 1-1 BBBD Race 1]|uniref:Chromo domain-containing protein n=1 Tax=Puccinia triticina (isolate 1-1 / race 1 (BBBD)) TaxID=630390 RepID=A0A180GR29_PUCT1|nr:hypothetical protein PTTG_26780 [Puccinia triticina 1-1 BBBD Race 1]
MRGVYPVFHVSVLRKHKPDSIVGRQAAQPDPVVVEGEDEWEVEEILDCRKRGKRLEYLIVWKGYEPQHNSWEPEDHLKNSKQLLDEFNTAFPQAAMRHKRTRRL